jgi:glucoamylase
MEGLASKGCLLCEQVWDEADVPKAHMRLGEPTGSAMPLVWAHAEYVKLLRSSADGTVFDRVPEVAERYLTGAGKNNKKMEVWKFNRRVRFMRPGDVLRIIAEARFRLRWTSDDWASMRDSASQGNALGIDYIDLLELATTSGMSIEFTFFWIDANRWEGRNYIIMVRS